MDEPDVSGSAFGLPTVWVKPERWVELIHDCVGEEFEDEGLA